MRAPDCIVAGVLLAGAVIAIPAPVVAIQALVPSSEPVCVFAGTVARVDTIRIDRRMEKIRARFRDVVFARGGNGAREVWFERFVSKPKPVWGRAQRVWTSVVYDAPPPLIFDKGVRYVVLADGAALDTVVVQVNQIQGVHKMVPDSSGTMVLDGTNLPESRYLESFRVKGDSVPQPVPAGN